MHDLRDAAQQAWPPFVLIAGLLMVGAVAHAAGLFDRAGTALAALPGPPAATLAGCMLLVAVVTATMNLDTAVVFLTPVLILVARGRGFDERPFLYAALFMANASSLFLPGANLTNLLVLGDDPVGGAHFARELVAPALVAATVTGVGVWALLGRGAQATVGRAAPDRATGLAGADGRGDGTQGPVAGAHEGAKGAAPRGAAATALVGIVVAAGLTVGVRQPALPVMVCGVTVAAAACALRLLTPAAVVKAVGPVVLVGLFTLSVALGVLARSWDGPATLLAHAGRWETAAVATLAAVGLNNLPAAVLLSSHHVEHARALLIGLNLGPNLAVTGSLSSYLWFRAARQVGASPSVLTVSRLGVILAPAAIVLATASLALGGGL